MEVKVVHIVSGEKRVFSKSVYDNLPQTNIEGRVVPKLGYRIDDSNAKIPEEVNSEFSKPKKKKIKDGQETEVPTRNESE